MLTKNFGCFCSCSLLFWLHCRSFFHLAGRSLLANSINSHLLTAKKFSCFFFQRNSSVSILISCSFYSLLSTECTHQKQRRKRLDFVAVVFSFQKYGWPCDFPPITPRVACGVIPVVMLVCLWCGGKVGRSVDQCTVTWLPNFLRWIDFLT